MPSQRHADLPEVLAALRVPESIACIVELETAIDYGPHLVCADRPIHRLESRAGAHCDSLNSCHRADELPDRNARLVSRYEAHDPNEAAKGERAERFVQACPRCFDDDIDSASASAFLDCQMPLRRRLVVDPHVSTQLARPA